MTSEGHVKGEGAHDQTKLQPLQLFAGKGLLPGVIESKDHLHLNRVNGMVTTLTLVDLKLERSK